MQAPGEFLYCLIIVGALVNIQAYIRQSFLNNDVMLYALTFIYGHLYIGNEMNLYGICKFDVSLIAYVYGAVDIILMGK